MQKVESALNRRIEQLQAQLKAAGADSTRRHLVQAILACIGIGEAITDYVATIEAYAKTRHAELKKTQVALTEQHTTLLESGKALLEQLKASPSDRALRKEIEQAQRSMAGIQKKLRRGADTLQQEVAPAIGLIDKIAATLKRLSESEDKEAQTRAVTMMVAHVQELYRAHPSLPSSGIIDAASWQKSAVRSVEEAEDFYDALARSSLQAIVALEVMIMALSTTPPTSAEDATRRADESVAQRLKRITERYSAE